MYFCTLKMYLISKIAFFEYRLKNVVLATIFTSPVIYFNSWFIISDFFSVYLEILTCYFRPFSTLYRLERDPACLRMQNWGRRFTFLGLGFFHLWNGADLQDPFLVSVFGLGSCILYSVLTGFLFFNIFIGV